MISRSIWSGRKWKLYSHPSPCSPVYPSPSLPPVPVPALHLSPVLPASSPPPDVLISVSYLFCIRILSYSVSCPPAPSVLWPGSKGLEETCYLCPSQCLSSGCSSGADTGIKWGGCKIILGSKKLEKGTKKRAAGEILFLLKRLKKGQI